MNIIYYSLSNAMACETIRKHIIVDNQTKLQWTLEISKWTWGELVYHVTLSGNLRTDSSGFHFNDSLWVTKQVMDIIRDYDYAKVYVTLNHPNWETDELWQLVKWWMARWEYNFYYLLF